MSSSSTEYDSAIKGQRTSQEVLCFFVLEFNLLNVFLIVERLRIILFDHICQVKRFVQNNIFLLDGGGEMVF